MCGAGAMPRERGPDPHQVTVVWRNAVIATVSVRPGSRDFLVFQPVMPQPPRGDTSGPDADNVTIEWRGSIIGVVFVRPPTMEHGHWVMPGNLRVQGFPNSYMVTYLGGERQQEF